MEEYPDELRTPPVTLVALVGCVEQHGVISRHLLSEQPPINTLALPDLSKIPLLLQKTSTTYLHSSSSGFLKRDWLVKRRTKIPAVIAALFTYSQVSGDPAQWLQVCSDLDNLKSFLRPRNIRLLLILLHSSSNDEDTSDDRLLALRKRAEVESKYLLLFNPNNPSQLHQSLQRLAATFADLAATYYQDEGRKMKTRLEKKTFTSTEHQIRYAFKVAVYAEFRRDWLEALRSYEDAYHTLRETVATATRLPAIQRLVEIKTVAERLHFKISTLLLHGGKIKEAISWFRQHIASYKKLVGPPEVIFLHWDWMSRQFLVFAELLETSSATVQNISLLALGTAEWPFIEWEFQPAYYYQIAAHYLKEKKNALELTLSISETYDVIDTCAESVVPSAYVGQFLRLLEQGDELATHPLTDEEYTRYAIGEGKRFQDSFEIIALLKKSYESYGNLKVPRMTSVCACQIAVEYFALGDFNNAKQLFAGVANLYRQEGWVSLLWKVLGYLRECSRRQGVVKDYIEYSLEMAALPASGPTIQSSRYKDCGPAGPPSLSQREMIHEEVFSLIRGEVSPLSLEGNDHLKVAGNNALRIEIDLVSPLRSVLLASVAFHEQILKPGATSLITVSLLSQLPLVTKIDQVEVQFNQSECNFFITNAQTSEFVAMPSEQKSHRVESAPSLALVTNKWLRLTYEIKSERSGKLECISIITKIGPHFTICCRAESPASMDNLPLWKFEDRVEAFPTKDPALAFSGQKAAQVDEHDPEVDLTVGAPGPALVGEKFIVPVTVTSRGHSVHSGELKFNLVDVKGGGLFSPRESEPFSMDSHHVELLGITGFEGKDEQQLGPDEMKKIQQSFGLVSLPFLNTGESWSCNLEIKWHRPKPVMLFVSLGYSPNSNESNVQKMNVHKSLQIEGKIAITISHRFMRPFRQNALLLSRIKSVPNPDEPASLPLNERAILIVSAKNCSEVPLQLVSMSIETNDGSSEKCCSTKHGGEDLSGFALLVPGEEFKKSFTVLPEAESSRLTLGTVHLKWRRHSGIKDQSSSTMTDNHVLTRHKFPDINLELPPLVASLNCPPYAVLGHPFPYSLRIRNQTELVQEIKFSLADSQSFVLCGSHSDTVCVLPRSEHILHYEVVPLVSGLQQLPRVSVTSIRYSAVFQPSAPASTVFIFPSMPNFKEANIEDRKEAVAAERSLSDGQDVFS